MHVALVVAYDGTDFHGYQLQRPELRTVQGELQAALERMTGQPIQTFASGRTDAGVHANGQIVTFDNPVLIPIDRLPLAINTRLPDDIRVTRAVEVPAEFNPRFDAVGKTYRYQVDISKTGNVFKRKTAYHFPYPIRVEPMWEALQSLLGTHDFTSFCAAATPVADRVRTLFRLEVEEDPQRELLLFWVEGSGFLWNMVRILVGTLMDVARGRISPASIDEILNACDRRRAGHTAPPQGLSLWEVRYPDEELNRSLYTR